MADPLGRFFDTSSAQARKKNRISAKNLRNQKILHHIYKIHPWTVYQSKINTNPEEKYVIRKRFNYHPRWRGIGGRRKRCKEQAPVICRQNKTTLQLNSVFISDSVAKCGKKKSSETLSLLPKSESFPAIWCHNLPSAVSKMDMAACWMTHRCSLTPWPHLPYIRLLIVCFCTVRPLLACKKVTLYMPTPELTTIPQKCLFCVQ